jgi:hypothetical protein
MLPVYNCVTLPALAQKTEEVVIIAFGTIKPREHRIAAFAALDGGTENALAAFDQVANLQAMGHLMWIISRQLHKLHVSVSMTGGILNLLSISRVAVNE